MNGGIISKPHPRKGTETFSLRHLGCPRKRNFKTTSPQGDGNTSELSRSPYITRQFQNHIPARGRKPCLQILRTLFFPFLISKPHPRKGTETFVENTNCCGQANISKPHPRKGTERANPSLPCRSGGGGPCEAWWKGRLERSAYLHREKGTSAVSAPTGSHRSPPPPSDGGGK